MQAPLGVVLDLDNTDGVKGPGLDLLAQRDNGVLLWIIL